MVIQHNMAAANTNRQLGIITGRLSKSTEKLSSGYRINRAGDDAAGLSISEKMRAQIRGLQKASKNAQDGISLIQTAEGALNETQDILQRMRELAVQAANDTNVTVDRQALQKEVDQLIDEIDRIADNTEFNGMKLLNGEFKDKVFHVGANKDQRITVTIDSMKSEATNINVKGLDISSKSDETDESSAADKANNAIETIEKAIEQVSTARSNLGAIQNRLEHTISNLNNTAENLQAAESRIRDVDMAEEMVNYSKNVILQQAAMSMLAQANQQNQGVLALLQ
jgi:Bacterial flagellin N-terminal helical region./Bacterial flagellin C-terminal helical region.